MIPTILILLQTNKFYIYCIYNNQILPLVLDRKTFQIIHTKINRKDLTEYRDVLGSNLGEAFYNFDYCLIENCEIVDYISNGNEEDFEEEKQEGVIQ